MAERPRPLSSQVDGATFHRESLTPNPDLLSGKFNPEQLGLPADFSFKTAVGNLRPSLDGHRLSRPH